MGSPSYMPPEQASGRIDQVGPHSDVYSLGAILYQLLTAKAPFVGESPLTTLRQVIEEDPVCSLYAFICARLWPGCETGSGDE